MEQMNIFEMMFPKFQIEKKTRLIELFGGVGAQAKALERLGVDFEIHRYSEWEVHACASYRKIHMREDHTDYSKGMTDKELVEALCEIGISMDGKNPMTKTKIKNKSEKWHRKVYNDFMATHNIGSVMNAKGEDLGITEKDKYTYILTYSFPCQDLSVAGKRKGMKKGSNTRSGLLWEVERLLNETEELPDVLLMENVTQVHGQENKADFGEWIEYLSRKGYQNFCADLNAKNYGVAQNRDRCFMVSILGEYHFKFPQEIELKKCIEDYLEEGEVDERYYLTAQKATDLINQLIDNGTLETEEKTIAAMRGRNVDESKTEQKLEIQRSGCVNTITSVQKDNLLIDKKISDETILTDRQTDRQTDRHRIAVDSSIKKPKRKRVANCITTREAAGIRKHQGSGTCVVERKTRAINKSQNSEDGICKL